MSEIEYAGGLYDGDINNPYRSLIGKKEDITELVVHKDTTEIKRNAFRNSNIEKVTFMCESCRIDWSSFHGSSVKEVIFYNSKRIVFEPCCFEDCKNLETIIFDEDGEYIFKRYSFHECSSLIEFEFPKKAKLSHEFDNDYECAFRGCGFKKIFLPKSFTYINTVFDDDVEIYYEGDVKDLVIEINKFETAEDYGFNFHRSGGSFTYHEEIVNASPNDKRFHSFVTREEYFKLIST